MNRLNASETRRVFTICAEADEILKPFERREWETLSRQEKMAAGFVGKWVCERLLRAFANATGRALPSNHDLAELLKVSGLPLPSLHAVLLEDIAKNMSVDPEDDDIWEPLFENALSLARGLIGIVNQTLVILSHPPSQKPSRRSS